MSVTYDPQSNSIRVEHTKEEYLKAVNHFGRHIWAAIDDDIAFRISFRHEHAHFTSFLATGLSELQSILQDWKLTILLAVLHDASQGNTLTVPVVHHEQESILSLDKTNSLKAAWEQAISIEGYLLGLGTKKSVGELFRFAIPDSFQELFDWVAVRINAPRYRKFLKQVCYTTAPPILNLARAAMPRARLGDRNEASIPLLSTRSILEAYAITIEVIAEYIKGMVTSLNRPRQSKKRVPSPVYSIAIEVILAAICPEKTIDLETYIMGRAGADVYWAVALTAYAAMQVPVLEDPEGETIAMGSLKQLNPQFRLAHIVENVTNGKLVNPLETYLNRSDRNVVIEWLIKCHASIGDPWSIKFYHHVSAVVSSMPEAFGQSASMHRMSWAARHNFFVNPTEMIADGGIWAEDVPCQIRFVRTADDFILCDGKSPEESSVYYLDASAIYVLQAMVFGDDWDSCWDKVCGFDTSGKLAAMGAVFGFYLGMNAKNSPTLIIRSGYG